MACEPSPRFGGLNKADDIQEQYVHGRRVSCYVSEVYINADGRALHPSIRLPVVRFFVDFEPMDPCDSPACEFLSHAVITTDEQDHCLRLVNTGSATVTNPAVQAVLDRIPKITRNYAEFALRVLRAISLTDETDFAWPQLVDASAPQVLA